MNKKTKQTYSVRGKLISAACMLLVAVIMVVSSTYAWFTLSTAPEVSGISTAVGANGALEMALRYGDGKTVRDGQLKAGEDPNTYWGNLVNLHYGDNGTINYGVDKIVLMPSALNVEKGTLGANLLSTPTYGADGRVSGLKAGTVSGIYDMAEGSFFDSKDFGFRAIGNASGMTDRQLSYRSAKQAASTAMAQAKNTAAASLNENGSTLANLALKKATSDTATYTYADVQALMTIVDDLLGTNDKTGALQSIEKAYMQYILAYAAGTAGGTDNDLAWKAVKGEVEKDGATLESVMTALTGEGVTVPTDISTPVDAYEATVLEVETAKTELQKLIDGGKTEFTWTEISTPLYILADMDAMEINGIAASEIKNGDNMSKIVTSVANGGVKVTMASGAGVYADIADHCGDYSASITIKKVEYNNLTLENMNAQMQTKSSVASTTGAYLVVAGNLLTSQSPEFKGASDEAKPLTEFYGYVIDLAFRTNAAESNLLLQTTPVDRIYDDNNNADTQGGGSSMTFASTTTGFSNDQVKALMECIRIVFFTPGDDANSGGQVIAYAKLDVDNATIGADGVTANMYLCEVVEETVTVYSNGDTPVYYMVDGKYYSDAALETEVTVTEDDLTGLTATTIVNSSTETMITNQSDAVITALTQNTPVNVSALVYLDGETITNKDVAADTASSMTGTANFQFSSSANLQPMEYGELHTPNATNGDNTNGGEDAGEDANGGN